MEVLHLGDESASSIICYSKRRDGKHKVHAICGIVFFAVLGLLFYLAYFLDGVAPTPLMLSDEINYPDSFISERAKNHLAALTQFGPRIVGSDLNVTVDFFKIEIEKIQAGADPRQTIEVDFQTASGSYFWEFQINAYANIQNIIVKVKGSSGKSVLVNAHYDTVPTSPGASDDGIMCAVMLEVLHKLSKSKTPPLHDVIFLFNGAEETFYQASHAFITQHKWAASAKILVNLEAAGSGHKEILFQSGPKLPWLLNYYRNVPHPYAQAVGEELFQSNLIPSDTDFRIFRDFGDMVGFDLAFYRNGYRYHTKNDDMKYIPLSSYQHAGDNILSLVRDLSNAPEILASDHGEEGKIVFYDVIGLFMITYSQLVAYVINIMLVLISIGITILALRDFCLGFKKRTLKLILTAYGFIFGGWTLSVLAVYLIALILDACYRTMSWYSNNWIVFGIYVAPVMAIIFGSMHLSNRFGKQKNVSARIHVQIQIHLTRMIWTLVLLIATVAGIRSAYVFMIPILFNLICFAVIKLAKLQHSPITWQVIYLISTIIPTLFLMYVSILVTSLFIPITGRMGNSINPELILCSICAFLTILIMSPYAPLIGMVKKPYITLGFLSACFLLTIILIATPIGFPYSDSEDFPTPQRHFVKHVSSTLKDYHNNIIAQYSGISMYNNDRNSPHSVKPHVPQINGDDWIPFEQPKYVNAVSLKLNSKFSVNKCITRFSFSVEGPDRITISLTPRGDATIKNTNLTEIIQSDSLYVHYVQGKPSPLDFTLDVQHPESHSNDALLNATISGSHIHSDYDKFNKGFIEFINSFPSWTAVIPQLVNLVSYVF